MLYEVDTKTLSHPILVLVSQLGKEGTKSGLGLQEKMLRYLTQLVHLSLYVAVAAGHDLKYVGYESCSFEKAWKRLLQRWLEEAR